MRIFTEQAIKEYAEAHPDAKVALQEWTTIVKRSEWTCFADVKKTFNSVDNIGNQHYVFNIKGNSAYSGGYPFSISGDIRSVPS